MGILKKAETGSHDIPLDETDFITVKDGISKKEFNALASAMPASAATGDASQIVLSEATEFQRYLFGALVVGWSLPGTCTVEDYDALDTGAANAVDEKLAEYFEQLLPSSAEEKSPST